MKKLLSLLLTLSIINISFAIPTNAQSTIRFEAENGICMDDDSVFPPALLENGVQIWEKSSLSCTIVVEEAGTYEIKANLSTEVKYITDGNSTTVDVYLGDELINESITISGTASGDYTSYSENNLGFVNLEPGENTLTFTIPNSWGARNIIFDYFILTSATLVECPTHIEAEEFGACYYTKGGAKTYKSVAELPASDRLSDGTGDGVGGYNAIMIRPGSYIAYSLAVAESGYYRLSICGVAQGNRTGYTGSWCDKRLVPSVRVNGVDQFDPASSYQKKLHTIRATGEGTIGTTGWGPYEEADGLTVYLNKGGNSFVFGFASGYLNPYNNQPFKMDYINFEYIGEEPDPNDKPNIQELAFDGPTTFLPSLYDGDASSYSSKNTAFEPSGDFLTLRVGSKLVYNVRATAGTYRLDVFTRLAGLDATGQVSVDVNGKGAIPTNIKGTSESWSAGGEVEKWAVVDLQDGINVISIQTGLDVMLSSLTFTPTEIEIPDPIWSPSKAYFTDSYNYYVDTTFDEEKKTGIVRGPGMEFVTRGIAIRRRDWYKLHFSVSEDATYLIQVHGVIGDRAYAPLYVAVDGGKPVTGIKAMKGTDWNSYIMNDLATMQLAAGEHDIEFGIEVQDVNYGFFADYIQFANISTFDMIGSRANGCALDGSYTVARGTDNMQFFFNGVVDEDTTKGAFKLKDSNGKELKTTTTVSNNVVNLLLYDSLKYGEGYTVSINGVVSTSSKAMNPLADIVFNVAGEGALDVGADVIDSAKLSVNYEDFNISGVVKSSHGLPISGRTVYVSIVDSVGAMVVADLECITADGGVYTLDYKLPSSSVEGTYTAIVRDEYSKASLNATAVYFASTTEKAFLDAIASANDADEVGSVIESFETGLGYDLKADLANVGNKKAFYADFVGKQYVSYYEFMADYDLFRNAESIRQKLDNKELEPILYSQELCDALGLSLSNLNQIVLGRNEFLAAVIRSRSISDIHEYVQAISELVNTYIAKENSLSALNFKASNLSLSVGRGITLTTALTSPTTKVVGATIVVVDNDGVFDKGSVKLGSGITYARVGDTYTFTLTTAEARSFSDAGSITVTATKAGKYSVTLSGSVTYEVGDGTTVNVPINEKDISITVSASSTGGGGGGGGGTSYAGGGSTGGSSTGQSTQVSTDKTTSIVEWLVQPFTLKDKAVAIEVIKALIK